MIFFILLALKSLIFCFLGRSSAMILERWIRLTDLPKRRVETSSLDLVRSSVVVINCMVQMYILMYILSRNCPLSCFPDYRLDR